MAETFAAVNAHSRRLPVTRLIAASKHRPVAVGVCEANGLEDDRWRGYAGPFMGGEGHPSPRSGDTAVLWRDKGTTYLGRDSLLLSRASTPDKVAGLPRFSSTVKVQCALGMVAFTMIHLHWIGPAASEPHADRVRQTDRGVRLLGESLECWEAQGFQNVLAGDFNVPRATRTPGWLSPWEMLADLGYTVRDRHLDAVAVSPGLEIAGIRWVPGRRLRTDHPGSITRVVRS